MKVTLQALEKYIQVVPQDLLDALQYAAKAHGVSLDVEIAARLSAYLSEHESAQDIVLSQHILGNTFTTKEAMAECKRNREAAFYQYEVEKLRLFLSFEQRLPRHVKETFKVIDVKTLAPQIKAELEAEARKYD